MPMPDPPATRRRFKSRLKRRLTIWLLAVLVVWTVAELGLRLSGVMDFPLYDADAEIGYIPSASQAGSFMRSNRWQFNAQHMGAGPFDGSHAADTLLVGDSIVLGGNPYREEDRLGPRLALALGQPVWPISAGSWSLHNQLTYLRRHPDVLPSIERFVFVLNGGDFERPSSWACELKHPRSAPWLATVYLARKYLYNPLPCDTTPPALQVPMRDWSSDLQAFLNDPAVRGKPVSFFLYPEQRESAGLRKIADTLEPYGAQLLVGGQAGVRVYSVGRDARWQPTLYRDAIHPSVEGTQVLAQIIATPTTEGWLKP